MDKDDTYTIDGTIIENSLYTAHTSTPKNAKHIYPERIGGNQHENRPKQTHTRKKKKRGRQNVARQLKNLLELVLLRGTQARREPYVDPDHQVTALRRLLGLRHPPPGISLFVARLCWAWFGDTDGFAVDRADDAFPARQGFAEADLDRSDEVVVVAFKVGVFFLFCLLAHIHKIQIKRKPTSVTIRCTSCRPPSSWSPTLLYLILDPVRRPALMLASSVTSITVRFPLASNALLFVVTFFEVPLNNSSSVSGSSFSTTVGSGVAARARDCGKPRGPPPAPAPPPPPAPPLVLKLRGPPPPNPPFNMENNGSSSSSMPAPPPIPGIPPMPPLALAKFLKISSAELNRNPPPPPPAPPGPVEKWNDREPPPPGMPPNEKPPGIPPAPNGEPPGPPPPAPAPPPGEGAGPPRRR